MASWIALLIAIIATTFPAMERALRAADAALVAKVAVLDAFPTSFNPLEISAADLPAFLASTTYCLAATEQPSILYH